MITCIFIGSVLTWHIYWPLSSLVTPLIWRVQVLKSLWVTESLALLVITCSWMARIALVSALIQATWYNQVGDELKYYFSFTSRSSYATSNDTFRDNVHMPPSRTAFYSMQVVTLLPRLRDKRLSDLMLPKVNNGNLVCIWKLPRPCHTQDPIESAR